MPYFDARHALLVGPPPRALLVSMMAMAGVLIGLAVQVVRHRDYS